MSLLVDVALDHECRYLGPVRLCDPATLNDKLDPSEVQHFCVEFDPGVRTLGGTNVPEP